MFSYYPFRAPKYGRRNSQDGHLAPGRDIKLEISSDTYNTEDESSRGEIPDRNKPSSNESSSKRPRMAKDGPAEQKIASPNGDAMSRTIDGTPCFHIRDYLARTRTCTLMRSRGGTFSAFQAAERDDDDARNDSLDGKNEAARRRTMRIYESTQREYGIKLRMLQIELERAELQRQTAVNELKTSEIKRQLIESQAADYFRSMRAHRYRLSKSRKLTASIRPSRSHRPIPKNCFAFKEREETVTALH